MIGFIWFRLGPATVMMTFVPAHDRLIVAISLALADQAPTQIGALL